MHPGMQRILIAVLPGLLAACAIAAIPEHVEQAGHGTRDQSDLIETWAAPQNSEIKDLLSTRMAHNGVGQVVGIVDSNGPRIVAHGHSGAPDGRPLDGDTIFQIGSVTKVITGLLLADMVVRGEANLREPLDDYLPNTITLIRNQRPITLYDLATHRSGLPSMPPVDLNGKPNPVEAFSPDDLVRFLNSFEPPRAPGEGYEYSNLGVSLLGIALAHRAGTTYESLVTERILKPLGMTDTSITLNDGQLARLAPGHSVYMHPIDSWEMLTLQASGSLRSTANDMVKLVAAYLHPDSTPLASAVRQQLRVGGTMRDFDKPLAVFQTEGGAYRHSGGKSGYRSGIVINPASGIGAIVLANSRTDDLPIDLAMYLALGARLPPTPEPRPLKSSIQLSPDELDLFAGAYEFENGYVMSVVRNGSNLLMEYPTSILEFEPSGKQDFYYNSGNDDISFQLNDDGTVSSLALYSDGKDGPSPPVHAERIP